MATSATFATILVEYLLKRMEEMGCKYLKTFPNIYGCGHFMLKTLTVHVVILWFGSLFVSVLFWLI